MNNLTLDAAQCLLMAKLMAKVAPQTKESPHVRRVFWEILPDMVADSTAHLLVLPAAVLQETDHASSSVLKALSLHPLPAILSPGAVNWRVGLARAWRKPMEKFRRAMGVRSFGACDYWEDHYAAALRGLARVDKCGMPPGMTCASVLPALVAEARYFWEHFSGTWQSIQKCLAALSEWRPAPNVITDPAVLKYWGMLWFELHQALGRNLANQKTYQKADEKPGDIVILKGITAKALLNLMENGGEEKTGIPAGMASPLLESLLQAVDIAGVQRPHPYAPYSLSWLSWQPQDMTRFPLDRLAGLPRNLLKRFRLDCQKPEQWWDNTTHESRKDALTELVRWEQSGLLASCGVDLLPVVVTEMNNYLNKNNHNFHSEYLLNHEVCRWLVRDEVANVKGGRELFQKLENHWQYECKLDGSRWASKCIAWYGRMQLQRAGLATETALAFHENLLEAIKKEECVTVQMMLSLWSPGKDIPDRMQRDWMSLWEERLNSDSQVLSTIAHLALLKPDPTDDLPARRQKLWDVLHILPKERRPKLSITEMTYLIGELEKLPAGGPNGDCNAVSNRTWQFKPDEMRFCVPTKPNAPVSTLANIQTVNTNRTVQRTAESEAQPDRCYK